LKKAERCLHGSLETPSFSDYKQIFTRYPDCIHELQAGPSRATAGPGKTLSRGPITTSPACAEIEMPTAPRERKHREGCPRGPQNLTMGLGSAISSPRGLGLETRSKMDFMHI